MLSIAVRDNISVGAACGDGKEVLPIIVLMTRERDVAMRSVGSIRGTNG